ncbi:hypothetical protein ABTX81_18420 [Kitasatospora sp. NPDC097605]|uniref:hypothetical protein n=1 Tax=Kitasatospora sp. NPDC097605 TaxID=3157226 RepID=UPI0033303408
MTDQQNTAPAVWDPTARGGAGGWVRGPQQPSAPTSPAAPAMPASSPTAPAAPPRPPQSPAGPPADDAPTAVIPQPVPPRPAAPGPLPPRTAPAFPQATPGAGPSYGAPHQPPQQPGHPQQAAFPPPPQQGYGAQPPYGHPGHYQPGLPQPARPQPGYDQPGYDQSAPYGPSGPAPYDHPQHDQPQHDYPTGYAEPDDEDRAAGRRAPLLIAFALLFVLALGGGILWAVRDKGSGTDQAGPTTPSAAATGGADASGNPPPAPAPNGSGAPTPAASDTAAASATPSPTETAGGPNAQSQAKALDELLTQGESAKAPIGNAVAKVNSCPAKPDIDAAAQVFDNGAKQRDQLLAKLATLSVTDLPGGADAAQSLKSAWQLSADIDRAYASWARTVAGQGCSGSAPNTADKKRADELNPQATQAKKDFVTKWKVIADQFGLTARTQDRI